MESESWRAIAGLLNIGALDLVHMIDGEILRGPIETFSVDENKQSVTFVTIWVARFNPVTMQWVRWTPGLCENLTVQLNMTEIALDTTKNTRTQKDDFIRIIGVTGRPVLYLVPHNYSQLHFSSLV